ncbi:SDR family oxidoreductase [Pseudomonas sp. TR47]|uniref:SDR family oxidoreductase n=1 Tax=Pseudomonas sp. TR47 TaxID=3342639 RepID=UPI00376FA5B8
MTQGPKKPAVLVTGVSSGIGQAIAEDLLAHGYRVFGSVRREADAASLIARGGECFVPLVLDVTEPSSLEHAVDQVRLLLDGRALHGLVNNAGVSFAGPILLQPIEEVRKIFEVNVLGLLAVTRAFVPLMTGNAASGESPGRIVNISSVSGGITVPFLTAYAGSKHAVEAISQGLRRELMPYGIHVASIQPGFIQSRLFEKAQACGPDHQYVDTDYSVLWQRFNQSLRQQEQKAKPAQCVAQTVRLALQASRPRTRYPLDVLWYLGKVLPNRLFDRLIFKALGIDRLIRG